MKYRPLGTTGLNVSEVGFGAWGIGGLSNGATSYGPTDDRESIQALRAAFDMGVTFYDTSDLYGYGHSEELIGRALGTVRDRIVLASKVGFLEHLGPQDFSPGHIRRSLDATLRRLGTTWLDVYQLHNPPAGALDPEAGALDTLAALRRDGKIRTYGISAPSPDEVLAVARQGTVPVVQVNLNMIDQRAVDNGLLDTCLDGGIGLIARTPLAFGFLSGAYTPETTFDPRHHCSAWSREQIALWADAYRCFEGATDEVSQTPAQRALRYCLSYPAVSTVIPGMLRVGEVDENVAASALGPLSTRERERIEQVYREHTFFLGRQHRNSAHRETT